MRALGTGGTGFVGGALVRALQARGDSVRVLARPTSSTATLEAAGVEIARGDILDRASIAAANHDHGVPQQRRRVRAPRRRAGHVHQTPRGC